VVVDLASAPAPEPETEPAPEPAPEPEAEPPVQPPEPRQPRIELGFRDGSTAAIAPGSEQAKALTDIASVLAHRDL